MTGKTEEIARGFVKSGRFSVGAGWDELTVSMFVEILERLQRDGVNLSSLSVRDFVVKEKRGRLICHSIRFEGIDEITERYEQASLRVCEVCGGVGRLAGDGEWWLSTRCSEHRMF